MIVLIRPGFIEGHAHILFRPVCDCTRICSLTFTESNLRSRRVLLYVFVVLLSHRGAHVARVEERPSLSANTERQPTFMP